jgi:diguanylate cyclase (GGDEF)-like protein
MKQNGHVSKHPNIFCILLCSALLSLIGFLDYVTGTEISFSIFYLIPVSLATWRASKWIGFLFCFVSTIVWLYSDLIPCHVYSQSMIPYWNAFVHLCFFLIVSILITKLKSSLMLEKELSSTDSLTGLLNVRAFNDLAYREINRFRRSNRPFTVAYIDVDNFKMVNDQFGHDAGNTLLRSIAETIKINTRSVDLIARVGGDEFVLLLGETGSEAAQVVLNKLHEQVRDYFARNAWPVTLSIGAVTYNKLPYKVDDILKKADNLMYAAKQSGKSKIIYESVD